MRRVARTLFALAFCALTGACASDPVIDAFDGDFERSKETQIIVGYCQSCHNHKDFEPTIHLSEMPYRYEQAPYASADDCRTCHNASLNVWRDIERVTYFPKGALSHD
jgi:hypothetical protein